MKNKTKHTLNDEIILLCEIRDLLMLIPTNEFIFEIDGIKYEMNLEGYSETCKSYYLRLYNYHTESAINMEELSYDELKKYEIYLIRFLNPKMMKPFLTKK